MVSLNGDLQAAHRPGRLGCRLVHCQPCATTAGCDKRNVPDDPLALFVASGGTVADVHVRPQIADWNPRLEPPARARSTRVHRVLERRTPVAAACLQDEPFRTERPEVSRQPEDTLVQRRGTQERTFSLNADEERAAHAKLGPEVPVLGGTLSRG